MALALRGLFSRMAISPKISPVLSTANSTSLLSTILVIFTEPFWMMYSSDPGIPSEKIMLSLG